MPPKILNNKNPFNPWKAVTPEIYNKIDEWKLINPSSETIVNQHPNPQIPNQFVYDAIKSRLMNLTPPIVLHEHIAHSPQKIIELGKFRRVIAHRNTLQGIDFIVEDRSKFLSAIENTVVGNESAFIKGSQNDWKNHWAMTLSFMATDGIGFREIYRPKIVDLPIDNSNNIPFDSRFGRDINIDISALHFAIADFPKLLNLTRCNIHIDNLTVTLGGINDGVGISPSVINHLVNELLFKTSFEKFLPKEIIDFLDISILNPDEGFLRAGITANLINTPNLKWKISYSVGLNNNTQREWSGDFKFEKSIGTSLVVRFNLGGG